MNAHEQTLWTSPNGKWRLVRNLGLTWTRSKYVLYESETFSHTVVYHAGYDAISVSTDGRVPDYVVDALYGVITGHERGA